MREVRTLRRWVRLGVYAAIFGSEPIYIFLLHFNLTQVLVGLAIGLTIAFCAIEGAFSQMFKLRKRSAYPAVLLQQLGAAATVGEAVGHGLEAIGRLTGASCCAALLDAGGELRLLPSPHMTPDEAEALLEAGRAAVTAAIAGQGPVVFGAAPPQAAGRRLVFVPVIALRQTIGVLALSGGPGHRDLKDEQLLQGMGKALGLSLENLRQKEDLRQSEERFRRVVTGAPVVLFAVDSDGIVTLIEGKGLETLGIAPEQVVGRPMTDVYARYPEIIEGIERSYAGEEVTFTAEVGGALFEARLCPVFGIDGRVSGVIGVATDITERKRAEVALRESEEKYRDLVENSNEVIYTLDATGIITYVNPVVEQLGGYAPSDVIGRSFTELIHPDDLMPLIESFQRTISGQLEPSEYRLKTKDGEYRWVRSSSRPIYDGDRAIGLRGLLVDLTERRNAEEALRAIVEGTAGETGSEFFHSLARHLASAVGARYAFVAELARGAPDRISTLAMWMGGDFGETAQYDLPGTPCEGVVAGEMRHYLRDVRTLFPDNRLLADMEIESYLGAPLFDSLGNTQGLLAVLDDKPMDDTPSVRSIMTIFAARAGAELERKQAEEALRESEAKNRALLGAIPDTVVRLRADGTYLDFKAGRDAAFNLPPEGLVGKRLQEVLPPDLMEQAMHHIQRALETGEPQIYEHRFQAGDNESYFEARIVASGHDEVVAIVRDITQRKQAEETIRRLAYHDALTGLPNRALFEDRLSVALAQARRHNQTLAVMFLDLDHFKTVNDTLGHSGGDKLLQSVAQELTLLVRDGDTVARVGGDEFTLLLPNITRIDDATNVAERVLEMLRQPRLLGGHEFQVGTSIGITVFPADGQDPERLLRNADTAMYRAKERGRDNYQLYTPAMNARIIERLALENDLRHALERQELFLLYQPLVEVASGRIVGAEALLRWQHPERGTVLPDEFIPFAEETGLILPIGDWVLETACLQNKRWQEDGHPPIRVTVNLSARQLQQEHLVATVARVLSEAALEPRYLQLEITEGAVMTNVEHIIAMLHELRVMGVGIAVDDFGTGYSSLSYLKRFPIDAVKIDRSFVRDLATDPNDAAIVTTVIAMSRSLNLKVIAEGVETERQLEFLRDRGCDEFQGYLFGRPMPPERIGGLLGGRRRVARARSA